MNPSLTIQLSPFNNSNTATILPSSIVKTSLRFDQLLNNSNQISSSSNNSNGTTGSPLSPITTTSSEVNSSLSSSKKRLCLQTPFRPSAVRNAYISSFQKAAKKARESLEFQHHGQTFSRTAAQNTSGAHCMTSFLTPGQPSLVEGIPNDSLILKFYTEHAMIKYRASLEGSMIPHIQAQYRDLQENYTLNLPDMTLPPCALIYNIDTLLTDGYIIQEKVLPFSSHSPLWNETTPWDTLSTLQLGYLSQLRDLFHYSFTSHKPGLDLKWDNLGVRSEHKESLVLFDFYEFDDEFYLNAKGFLHDLSQGNPAIRDFLLEGLQDKCNSILIIDPIGSFPAFSQDTILWFPKDEKEMARYKTLRSLLIDRAAHLAV